ncbi:putative 23S rRNA pseudouridine(955/2504/2580) synthase [Helianthus annuus]|uniref:23S rRNA pseudouridine(955/2504/2580) synthase n=1 Tax=Helianthus annuus TaxID=4232 RepID=A0A251UNH6_HELAN|nr:RNA pseudouridine synthase 6, chloroplastic isoform X1 [Helianthus annuus]KAF5782756.1 putative 23S rRNA pseudouridine(955/2504/2580) synthase [Helianthus annuus]KAJ0510208.1 putative 23S rRNA pseudouridine(955/2504/2580) synthase [Helianthus annuus]KAJ0518140.1 putative 23S rRNA pseudouridine(955/2504/2580) synthase [Helianthus annuus]KAJ0875860.1 putative 23S rRNA pseudouridine(955/2504/2580) synthase [Helianthus annuus]
MASSLQWLPKIRNFIIAPVALQRALTAANHRHRHRHRHRHTAVASACQSMSTLNSVRHEEYGRLLPCPSENVLPRNIEHLVVREEGPVLDFIAKALDLPPLYVADLIHFGAVHYALVCPKPPLTATSEEIKLYKEFTKPSVLRKRPSIKGKTVREAQNTFRVTQPDQLVEAGTYVRVHVRPKRFPRCYEVDWKSRIIAVTESYVVLNKPAGTSVGGTTDNIEETCVTFATRALELTTPLRTTHQIDNCTEGCVVLARTKDYCSVFHRKIREKQVKKLYLALAAAYVPCGVMTHYMRPFRKSPKIISEHFIKGWNVCQLEVLECRRVPWPEALVEEKYGIENIDWPNKEFAYECKVNLLTGRTHQIRAQLAGCGAPIVGDSMYMPAVMAELASSGLNPFGKYGKQFESEAERELAAEEWAAKHGKEPRLAIALQACQISWDEGDHFYEAGPPWWAQ